MSREPWRPKTFFQDMKKRSSGMDSLSIFTPRNKVFCWTIPLGTPLKRQQFSIPIVQSANISNISQQRVWWSSHWTHTCESHDETLGGGSNSIFVHSFSVHLAKIWWPCTLMYIKNVQKVGNSFSLKSSSKLFVKHFQTNGPIKHFWYAIIFSMSFWRTLTSPGKIFKL